MKDFDREIGSAKRDLAATNPMALHDLRTAAEKGDRYAQFYLGTLYDPAFALSKIMKPDQQEAVRWYSSAADQGMTIAQNNLWSAYLYGNGVPQDYAKAVYWIQKSADQNDPVSMNALGWCYQNGHGLEPDFGKARFWYQRAADAGVALAKTNLDDLAHVEWYAKRDKVVTDRSAFDDIVKAANEGDTDASFVLGTLYDPSLRYQNKFVPPNAELTLSWYLVAAKKGQVVAQYNCGVKYREGLGVSQDYVEALGWFRRAADQNYASAMNEVGRAYRDGNGISQNLEIAKSWFKRAIDAGSELAKQNLADLEADRNLPPPPPIEGPR